VNDRLTISASARVNGDWFFSTGQSPFLADVFAGSVSARIFDMAFGAQPQYWPLSIIGKNPIIQQAQAGWKRKCVQVLRAFLADLH
jgi:hypothetical protein